MNKAHFSINLGKIVILSELISEPGRWIKFPQKVIRFMRVKVKLYHAEFVLK